MATAEDLSPQAVRLARRLQALPDDRSYAFVLIKLSGGMWMLSIWDERGVKIETLRK
jgi:hypothetical protein